MSWRTTQTLQLTHNTYNVFRQVYVYIPARALNDGLRLRYKNKYNLSNGSWQTTVMVPLQAELSETYVLSKHYVVGERRLRYRSFK